MAPATSRTPSARPVASSAFAIYGRSRIDLAPTARSSASSRRCFVSGPTRGPTARRTSAAGRCPAGSATTTPSARTRRSATSRRWPFSGGPGDERAWTQQLERTAVERRHGELRRLDAVETPDVDRDHRRAVGARAARERADSAVRAEEVVDPLLPELVVREGLLAGEQPEAVGGREGQQRAGLRADRAVALDHAPEIGGHFVADAAAMAAARPGLRFGHGLLV